MKKYFLTGLVIFLPLAITIAFIIFLINLFTAPFVGIVSEILTKRSIIHDGFLFLSREQLIVYGSKLIILVLLFLIIILLGVIARWFLISTFLRIGDRIMHRIPLVKTVYKTLQDIINGLFASDKKTFHEVVLAPFPSKGIFVVALIVREAPPACNRAVGEEMVTVLVPTTPNVSTGFLVLYKPSELIYLPEMRTEDAIKYIVSCGVIVPPLSPRPPKKS